MNNMLSKCKTNGLINVKLLQNSSIKYEWELNLKWNSSNLNNWQKMDRKEVNGKHDDNRDQHFGHFASSSQLVVQGSIRWIQPAKQKKLNFLLRPLNLKMCSSWCISDVEQLKEDFSCWVNVNASTLLRNYYFICKTIRFLTPDWAPKWNNGRTINSENG